MSSSPPPSDRDAHVAAYTTRERRAHRAWLIREIATVERRQRELAVVIRHLRQRVAS